MRRHDTVKTVAGLGEHDRVSLTYGTDERFRDPATPLPLRLSGREVQCV